MIFKSYRFAILATIFSAVVAGLFFMGPVPQDLAYHNFADQRRIIGIPNFWDVMSNLPMLFIGTFGIYYSINTWKNRSGIVAKWLPLVLCFGIFTACFGSAYYHWSPDNYTLVWDRLPMTLMFMPLFALIIYDFIGRKMGEFAFYTLIPLGVFSVFYWSYTEIIGNGDLRVYAFVQFFPMLAVPFIIWLFYKKTTYLKYIIYVLVWYILAKLAEHFDKEIFEATGFWSGHTMKHLLASVALIYVVKLIVGWDKSLTTTAWPKGMPTTPAGRQSTEAKTE